MATSPVNTAASALTPVLSRQLACIEVAGVTYNVTVANFRNGSQVAFDESFNNPTLTNIHLTALKTLIESNPTISGSYITANGLGEESLLATAPISTDFRASVVDSLPQEDKAALALANATNLQLGCELLNLIEEDASDNEAIEQAINNLPQKLQNELETYILELSNEDGSSSTQSQSHPFGETHKVATARLIDDLINSLPIEFKNLYDKLLSVRFNQETFFNTEINPTITNFVSKTFIPRLLDTLSEENQTTLDQILVRHTENSDGFADIEETEGSEPLDSTSRFANTKLAALAAEELMSRVLERHNLPSDILSSDLSASRVFKMIFGITQQDLHVIIPPNPTEDSPRINEISLPPASNVNSLGEFSETSEEESPDLIVSRTNNHQSTTQPEISPSRSPITEEVTVPEDTYLNYSKAERKAAFEQYQISIRNGSFQNRMSSKSIEILEEFTSREIVLRKYPAVANETELAEKLAIIFPTKTSLAQIISGFNV